jgi:hypothetical protein
MNKVSSQPYSIFSWWQLSTDCNWMSNVTPDVESSQISVRTHFKRKQSHAAWELHELQVRIRTRCHEAHLYDWSTCKTTKWDWFTYLRRPNNIKILMTLPSSYRSFLSAWNNCDESKKTLKMLEVRLLAEENMDKMASLNVKSQDDAALWAANRKSK